MSAVALMDLCSTEKVATVSACPPMNCFIGAAWTLTCNYIFFPGRHACVPLQVGRKNTETVSDSKKKIVYLLVICDLLAGLQHCLIGFVAVGLGVYLNPKIRFSETLAELAHSLSAAFSCLTTSLSLLSRDSIFDVC